VRGAERVLEAGGDELGIGLIAPPEVGRHAPVVGSVAILVEDPGLDADAVAGELLPERGATGEAPVVRDGGVDLHSVGEEEPASLLCAVAPQLVARGVGVNRRGLLTRDGQPRLREESRKAVDASVRGRSAFVSLTGGEEQERKARRENHGMHVRKFRGRASAQK
jgi:hypothetical protein